MNDENRAQVAAIAAYLQTLDGAPRTADDVISWALDVVKSMRPDVVAALAAGGSNG